MTLASKLKSVMAATLVAAFGFAAGLSSRAQAPAASANIELLPREREMAIALSAGPAHFADQAGVYVLEKNGYVKVRESKNGFTCLVERHHLDSFEPQCLDAEGAATTMQVMLYKAELRAQGKSEAEANRLVADGYAAGRFRAPRRPGIAYMLSSENRLLNPATGKVVDGPPHLMFYAPYLTNADVGYAPGSPVFVIDEGTPEALMIVFVPAPKAEMKK